MAEQSLEQLEQEFHQIVSGIHPADVVTKGNAQKKWNSIAKPLHSLGKLEDHIMQIAALTGDTDVNLNRKALKDSKKTCVFFFAESLGSHDIVKKCSIYKITDIIYRCT